MPRKKSEHCRLAILRACLKVLDEKGYLDLTIEEVASTAQAGKQTVYRHFGSKARLALEAFAHIMDQGVPADTGSLATDLRTFLFERIERIDFPKKRQMVSGLLAEAQNRKRPEEPKTPPRSPQDQAREVPWHSRKT